MIRKEDPNKKTLLRDSIIVGICSSISQYIYIQFSTLAGGINTPHVFVGEPDF